jgi:hypothetical protein
MIEDLIDRAVEEAARSLTSEAPSPALRARVLARLAPRRTQLTGRWLPAALAIPAVMVVLAIAWETSRRATPPAPAIPRGVAAAPDAPVHNETRTDPDARERRTVEEAARRRAQVRRLTIDPSDVDALAPPPLLVPPLAVQRIGPVPIAVEPLGDVAPLEITPLEEPEGDRQ